MKGLLKLNRSKFYNRSIRFVISFLSVSFCISAAGCLFPLIWGIDTYNPTIVLTAGIQPLPENHGRWSKEEVDTVIDTIATAAKRHGLKKKWEPDRGYTLSGKDFDLSLNACFLYDKNGSRHKSRSLIESSNPLPWAKPNIQKEKGTIYISIYSVFETSHQITDSERLLVEKIWHEVLDPLRYKFGERLEEVNIKIYKLEP